MCLNWIFKDENGYLLCSDGIALSYLTTARPENTPLKSDDESVSDVSGCPDFPLTLFPVLATSKLSSQS